MSARARKKLVQGWEMNVFAQKDLVGVGHKRLPSNGHGWCGRRAFTHKMTRLKRKTRTHASALMASAVPGRVTQTHSHSTASETRLRYDIRN